ncbi:hypothetical protein WKH56_19845 [Priestia sp. SB1]|uniref:hypothetical protein n=1 Tax=Priestia sp. SB1 TaxID=3132359 RepID=UPI00316E4232
MARKVKCPHCEKMMEKEEAVSHQKRYYHEACLKDKQKSIEDRKDLIAYICELYRIDAPTGMMLKQIKEFETDFKYKLKGIELALRYFYETSENNPREGDGIGIVPYVYEKAKKHYILKKNVEKSVKEAAGKEIKQKVVTVKSPEMKVKKKIEQIDMNAL